MAAFGELQPFGTSRLSKEVFTGTALSPDVRRNLFEAMLVDQEAADQVWDAWNAQTLNDGAACIAWMTITGLISPNDQHGNNREA